MWSEWCDENSQLWFYEWDCCINICVWYPWSFSWHQIEQQNSSAPHCLNISSYQYQYQTFWNKNDTNSVLYQDHDVLFQQSAIEYERDSLNQKYYWHCFLSTKRGIDFNQLCNHFMHKINQEHQRTNSNFFWRFWKWNFQRFHILN